MTPTEMALEEVAAALNALALAVLALVVVLIALSWSVDDIALRVNLFGVMLRRRDAAAPAATHSHSVPPVAPAQPSAQPSAVPDSVAQKAAKADSETHAQ